MKKNSSLLDYLSTKNLAYGYSHIRLAHFALQGALLPLVDLVSGTSNKDAKRNFFEHMQSAFPKIQKLFDEDSNHIANGLYPVSVLAPENPVKHLKRIPLVFFDAFRANQQRKNKKSNQFDKQSQELLDGVPSYYRRNFHYQDSGYLGDNSAQLYEHQVEVLFSGSADAMRRQAIVPLKKKFSNSNGEGLHFLEIGSGTGRLTRFMALAFPKAKITCVDLSSYYLATASTNLKDFRNISFLQAQAEKLDFKDQIFDAVYSSYLFHELPKPVRSEVLAEGLRLLKPNGIYVIADSIQKNDDPELNWALEQFPKDFHEPFYKSYVENSLENLLKKAEFKITSSQTGFLTKVVAASPSGAE